MTVEMQSLDASPLGALVRSPLGAFNRPRRAAVQLPGILGIVWIDECRDTYWPPYPIGDEQWLEDWEEYLRRVDRYGNLAEPPVVAKGIVMHVATDGNFWTSVGAIRHSHFLRKQVGRPPIVPVAQEAVLEALATSVNTPAIGPMATLDHIVLQVDNSGSMFTSTIQPFFDLFVDWLESRRGLELGHGVTLAADARIVIGGPTDERWMEWILPAPW